MTIHLANHFSSHRLRHGDEPSFAGWNIHRIRSRLTRTWRPGGWLNFYNLFLGISSVFWSYFLWFGFFGSAFFCRFFFPQTFGSCSPNPPSPPWQCLEAGYHASSDSRQWHDSGNRPGSFTGLLVRLLGEWLVIFLYPKNASKPKGFSPFWEKTKVSCFELLKFDNFCLKSLVDLQDLLRTQPVKKNQTLQPKYWTSLH